jgi:hypothetical protein
LQRILHSDLHLFPYKMNVIIKMCYVYNQWYDISCATLDKKKSVYIRTSNINIQHCHKTSTFWNHTYCVPLWTLSSPLTVNLLSLSPLQLCEVAAEGPWSAAECLQFDFPVPVFFDWLAYSRLMQTMYMISLICVLRVCDNDDDDDVLCLVMWRARTPHHQTQHTHPQYSIDCSSIEHISEGTRNDPWRWQCNAETCRSYHT